MVSSGYSKHAGCLVKCVQMNYKLAYHDPKRKAVGRQASRALRARGRATWRHLGTNFAPNSPTTETGLVSLSLVQEPQSLLLLSSPLSGANV